MDNYNKNLNKYYNKVIVSFIIFALALTFFLSVLLYFNYETFTLQLINKSKQDVLIQVGEHMGKLHNYASTNIFNILNNPSARRLMLNAETELNQYIQDIKVIENVRNSNPYSISGFYTNFSFGVYQ